MANYLLDTNHANRLMSLDDKLLTQMRYIHKLLQQRPRRVNGILKLE